MGALQQIGLVAEEEPSQQSRDIEDPSDDDEQIEFSESSSRLRPEDVLLRLIQDLRDQIQELDGQYSAGTVIRDEQDRYAVLKQGAVPILTFWHTHRHDFTQRHGQDEPEVIEALDTLHAAFQEMEDTHSDRVADENRRQVQAQCPRYCDCDAECLWYCPLCALVVLSFIVTGFYYIMFAAHGKDLDPCQGICI